MPTIAQVAQDRPYIVGLTSSFTVYASYLLAQAAANTLSAANSNAPVYVAQVVEGITAPNDCDLVAGGQGGPGKWIVQLVSGTTYLPKATAEAQAFSTSASNSNGQVLVARTFQTVTAP